MVPKLENAPNRIRELRRKHGLTLQDVADRVGCKANEVSRFETGARELSIGWARRIARAFGTDIASLLNDEDNFDRLDEQERAVIDAMRTASSRDRIAVQRVAESLTSYTAENDDEPRRSA
ncbi:helix-turn-helix domain-containing protein [Sphingomonas hankookensis]|uniref:helix-turn-helix domain-containing protein n=1 Tax=Sphingomonas hankookensis TaxID=563996 RepID=UPI001F57B65A|nr:helix-turn-helix transcriptional regulator [Sphingomonas hankookensis]